MKSLFKHSENISQAIIIIIAFEVCGCVVVLREGKVVWCGFCGCHFAVFSFDFLQERPYLSAAAFTESVSYSYGTSPAAMPHQNFNNASLMLQQYGPLKAGASGPETSPVGADGRQGWPQGSAGQPSGPRPL